MGAQSLTDLKVWQATYSATLGLYTATERFPATETYGLENQIRRAVVSIGCNICEGFGRRCPRDKAHFYTIAYGSAEEIKHCLLIARGLKYLKDIDRLYTELESISKMLRSLTDCVLRGAPPNA
jgi:four helix bundle protein